MGISTQILGKKTFYNKFLGYNSLTPSWSYASQYVINSGVSYSATTSYSYDGISANLTASFSYGVSIYIPADSTRASRLGASGDVTVEKCRDYNVNEFENFTIDYLSVSTVSNVTNQVYYK